MNFSETMSFLLGREYPNSIRGNKHRTRGTRIAFGVINIGQGEPEYIRGNGHRTGKDKEKQYENLHIYKFCSIFVGKIRS